MRLRSSGPHPERSVEARHLAPMKENKMHEFCAAIQTVGQLRNQLIWYDPDAPIKINGQPMRLYYVIDPDGNWFDIRPHEDEEETK